MSDQRRWIWKSGGLISTPIADGWAPTLTVRDPQVPNLPLETAAGGNTTAPTVTASFTWAGSASAPIIGVRVPTVVASYQWAASSNAPLVGVRAPVISAAWQWAASPSAPTYGTVTPTVTASFTWSANASAPVVAGDTITPTVQTAFSWQAFAYAPVVPTTGGFTGGLWLRAQFRGVESDEEKRARRLAQGIIRRASVSAKAPREDGSAHIAKLQAQIRSHKADAARYQMQAEALEYAARADALAQRIDEQVVAATEQARLTALVIVAREQQRFAEQQLTELDVAFVAAAMAEA